MFHPWHQINLFKDSPAVLPAVIEIPRGSKVKYELDKETGMIKVDRILYSAVHYPANYGFIPQTYCEDNDPLDVLIFGQESFVPLSIITIRPIGMLEMIDQGEADDKIIAVHANDPEYAHINSIEQLPPHKLKELKHFFEDYKTLENKKVVVNKLVSREEAIKVINQSIEYYKKHFPAVKK